MKEGNRVLKQTREQFERDFICPKCHGHGALSQEVAIGRGMVSSMLGPSRYLAVSCGLCGYTEFYQLAIIEKETEEFPAMAKLADPQK